MIMRGLQSLATACLALTVFADAVDARASPSPICYDKSHNVVSCPKKPISPTKVIIIVVVISVAVLAAVGFFLFKIFRRRRRTQKYESLPPPASGTTPAQEGVMTPAAPGEMGYAGPHPQMSYAVPQLTYNAPQLAVHAPPSSTAYAPPPGPPPQTAATHYGYSVGAI